jgi:hypothetical protein
VKLIIRVMMASKCSILEGRLLKLKESLSIRMTMRPAPGCLDAKLPCLSELSESLTMGLVVTSLYIILQLSVLSSFQSSLGTLRRVSIPHSFFLVFLFSLLIFFRRSRSPMKDI